MPADRGSAQAVQLAAHQVRERCPLRPTVGLVLGSGLAGVADELADVTSVPYAEIPGCPLPTVPGHAGRLVLGRLAEQPVAVLVGRVHLYEGYHANQVAFGVRLLAGLGCRSLVLTNAAGGIDPRLQPGDLMLIADHLNLPGLAGQSPLVGLAGAAFGPRFVDVADAYDPALRELAARVGHELGLELQQGVYAMVAGPSYESPAEVRLLRAWGADAVGMSTVPEVLAARQLGLRVLAISCITNLAAGLGAGEAAGEAGGEASGGRAGQGDASRRRVSHAEVLAQGLAAGPRLASLIREVLRRL